MHELFLTCHTLVSLWVLTVEHFFFCLQTVDICQRIYLKKILWQQYAGLLCLPTDLEEIYEYQLL